MLSIGGFKPSGVSSKAFKSAVTKFHEVKKKQKKTNGHENKIHTVITSSDWDRKLGVVKASGGVNAPPLALHSWLET